MGFFSGFSTALSNVSHAVQNIGTAASNIGTTFGPIVSAFNPAAGAVLSQVGQLGGAVAGQRPAPANNIVAQSYATAAVAVPVNQSALAGPTGLIMGIPTKYVLIGGGVLAVGVLLLIVMKG